MIRENELNRQTERGWTDLHRERANCGVGVLMDLSGHASHKTVEDALEILRNLDHRGARGAEENTGDGAGILIQKPHAFFQELVPGLGDSNSYGVGQIFFPNDEAILPRFVQLIEQVVTQEGFEAFHWRRVPTNHSGLGKTAVQSEPIVQQLFVRPQEACSAEELDIRLYVLRRALEKAIAQSELPERDRFYICSLDRRKLVYKGLLTNAQVETYYPDLQDERVTSSLALVHARFSTNTLGSWDLAHPYRSIIHNGEINTYRGNLNWMRAREADLAHPRFGKEIEKLKPVTTDGQSDTAILDNVLELIVESGRSLAHALRMLIPEAWNKDPLISSQKRDWYDYHSTLVEPWDGPALVAFTDGYSVGAVLDRNGFRPCRYTITKDNRLVLASEVGVLNIDPSEVKEKGRLKPGQMFLADADQGRILSDAEVFERLTDHQYGEWLKQKRVRLPELVDKTEVPSIPEFDDLTARQCALGYTLESINRYIEPMSQDGKDPVGAMGDDTPPSVLSTRIKPLFSYFKQFFAQVSNPPIDYIREDMVTTLESHIGRQANFLNETEEHCRQLFLKSPILRLRELEAIKTIDKNGIRSCPIDMTFPKEGTLEKGIEDLRAKAANAIREGFEILVLSDRNIGPDRLPIPSLLAVGGLHHHLIRLGLRTRAAIVVDSGEPSAVHHFCTLIGYGADAICPYLAYATIQSLNEGSPATVPEAIERYISAVEDGIQKVMSKMGISTLESYKGAQIFEALGLNQGLIREYFSGTISRISGIGITEIHEDVVERHRQAFQPCVGGNLELDQGGDLYWRRDGEFHQWNPDTVGILQYAVRTGNPKAYKQFAKLINHQDEQLQTLRGLVDFKGGTDRAIPLEEVEPVEQIFKRFFTGSMSFGALSLEAHEALAIAINRLGGTACSGEGGEQRDRFGTERECSNKQVASGRFGVTSHYLTNAKELEIKIAQGAKPGEGGQLPGEKVDEMIAQVRFTTPGVGLISPPPHHDIYSIEDLAQLIHDLKCINPDAGIHVKLVSEAGVGTIAAGVSKARADAILIAGDSGGTGAAAKTSIKSAGLPWELGLTEANQVLLSNRLRSRVKLRVDGGFKTGRDVVVAALLGAEEYGFGTSALVALGCVMLRKCHCNTCSVGVATQDPELRKRFPGKPEHLMNYLRFIAEEVREIMANLGFRTMEEMIGKTDRLAARSLPHPRAHKTDLSPMLYLPDSEDDPRKTREQNHKLEGKLDYQLIEAAKPAIEQGTPIQTDLKITNHDRTFGTLLSSRIAKRYGAAGLPHDTILVNLTGAAGQSFGAFLSRGMTFHLEGEANDYVGKGLSGGKITITTPPTAAYEADKNILLGNVALYGATSGEVYLNGIAGERFAVRNSGVHAVVEGVGNHGCEYMTGGIVVILGDVGRNFAAGMSGGEAYVFHDGDEDLEANINTGMVRIERNLDQRDHEILHRMVENHHDYTKSTKAKQLLDRWEQSLEWFVKVMPVAYEKVALQNLDKGIDIRATAPPPRGECETVPVA